MKKTQIASLIAGSALMTASMFTAAHAADTNPFEAVSMDAGYEMAFAGDKAKDGKCGEGKCGGEKTKDGNCGAEKGKKAKDGNCGADQDDKAKDGSCGADKHDKAKDGKCGEGKCGGLA